MDAATVLKKSAFLAVSEKSLVWRIQEVDSTFPRWKFSWEENGHVPCVSVNAGGYRHLPDRQNPLIPMQCL